LIQQISRYNFDDKQKEAINLPFNKSALILSPPGFGKTFIMTKRIEYLLRRGDVKKPYQILGLTFTNAAANEMKRRVLEILPNVSNQVLIFNFHSLCFMILKYYGYKIGLKKDFLILSSNKAQKEKDRLLENEIYNNHLNNKSKNIFLEFKSWYTEKIIKNNNYHSKNHLIFNKVINNYKEYLKQNNCIDFDFLLFFTIELFEEYPKILEYYRKSFYYILVDEFQDTNPQQYLILKYLINGNKNFPSKKKRINFMIFADELQSIFRGFT